VDVRVEATAVRLLFLKHSLTWPRVRGHDVHTYSIMKALELMGHELNLFTVERPDPTALAGLPTISTLSADVAQNGVHVKLSRLQDRFRSYWGVSTQDVSAFAASVEQWRPDAVIASGPEVLPYLAAADGVYRVWYAADDLCWQHLTQVRNLTADARFNLKAAAVNALYERSFAGTIDCAWAVSAIDARALRWIGGFRRVDVVPNGVDTDHFQPRQEVESPDSAIFWGNLAFEPNVRAILWFSSQVWPIVRQRRPGAVLTVAGFSPSPLLLNLSGRDGINVVGAVDDLGAIVAKHAVAVMPFQSGSGLKNKMLEAAALARPTVCSRAAINGLCGAVQEAFILAERPQEWAAQLETLWDDADARAALGRRARIWVETNHTWDRAAQRALDSLAAGSER
jgi:glycosyltransferase involved in cell wall biosynthesis